MDYGLIVAIVTAAVSLVIAVGNAAFTAYREARSRQASAKMELDRVRAPLLRAALDLAARLDNIRHDYFLHTYLQSTEAHRAEIARTSTFTGSPAICASSSRCTTG